MPRAHASAPHRARAAGSARSDRVGTDARPYRRARCDKWQPHPRGAKPRDGIEVPVICNGMAEKTPHATQKPEALIERLILASSKAGDLVVAPFVGSGTAAVVAARLGRKWLAGAAVA